jgi:hypothetical protein
MPLTALDAHAQPGADPLAQRRDQFAVDIVHDS